jgi:hypothetical protein
MKIAVLLIALALVVAACSGSFRETGKSNARPGDTEAMLWERTPEKVLEGLTAPEQLNLLWHDIQMEPYRSIFLDSNGNFRQDRIPQLRLHRARTLVDASEQAAIELIKSQGDEPTRYEILAAQRELGDWYVGGLWVPGVGYIGEVWAPVYGLPYDESGNAGGIISWFFDFKPPVQTLAYQSRNTELYWARIEVNHKSALLPEKSPTGEIIGFVDSRTARRYAVAEGAVLASSSQGATRFGLDFDGLPLVLDGRPIHLIRTGD